MSFRRVVLLSVLLSLGISFTSKSSESPLIPSEVREYLLERANDGDVSAAHAISQAGEKLPPEVIVMLHQASLDVRTDDMMTPVLAVRVLVDQGEVLKSQVIPRLREKAEELEKGFWLSGTLAARGLVSAGEELRESWLAILRSQSEDATADADMNAMNAAQVLTLAGETLSAKAISAIRNLSDKVGFGRVESTSGGVHMHFFPPLVLAEAGVTLDEELLERLKEAAQNNIAAARTLVLIGTTPTSDFIERLTENLDDPRAFVTAAEAAITLVEASRRLYGDLLLKDVDPSRIRFIVKSPERFSQIIGWRRDGIALDDFAISGEVRRFSGDGAKAVIQGKEPFCGIYDNGEDSKRATKNYGFTPDVISNDDNFADNGPIISLSAEEDFEVECAKIGRAREPISVSDVRRAFGGILDISISVQ